MPAGLKKYAPNFRVLGKIVLNFGGRGFGSAIEHGILLRGLIGPRSFFDEELGKPV
jgi:hypothetical protein